MEWLKRLFGDAETMTADELAAKIKADGKIVDLRSGEYVSKHKLEDMTTKRDELVTKLAEAEARGEDPEGLKKRITELEGLVDSEKKRADAAESGKTRIERESAVADKLANKRFTRWAVSEIEALVNESTTFDEALASWLDDNPDYAATATDDDADDDQPVVVKSGEEPKGKPKPDKFISGIDAVFAPAEGADAAK